MKLKNILMYSLLLGVFAVLELLSIGGDSAPTEVTKGWIAALPALMTGVSSLASIFQGSQQRRQARQLEQQNVRPTYTPSAGVVENVALARQNARAGLPDQVYNNQLTQMQQNLATGLRGLGARGGNAAVNANSLIRSSNQNVANLNAMDAQARQQGTNQLMQANQAMAAEERQAFNVNQLQPWQMNQQNIVSQRRAGTQNIFGGLGMLAQGSMMGVFSGLGGNAGTATTPATPPINPTSLANKITSPFTNLYSQF